MTHNLRNISRIVRNLAATVPGVHVTAVDWGEVPPHPHPWVAGTRPSREIVVTANAWGPTLHARIRQWKLGGQDVATGMTDGDADIALPHTVRTLLRYILEDQRALAEAGAALGLDAPMPIPARVTARDLAHLLIDTVAADAMVAQSGASGAVRAIADQIAMLLAQGAGCETQLVVNAVAFASFEDGRTVLSPVVQLGSAPRAALTGNHLTIDGRLPETRSPPPPAAASATSSRPASPR